MPPELWRPRETWKDKGAFDEQPRLLAGLFAKNFAAYAGGVSEAVRAAGPG